MGEPIKIAIVLEGGCLSAVLTAGVPVEYVLVDYDTEGADPSEVHDIPQTGGGTEAALSHTSSAEMGGEFVLAAFRAVEEGTGPLCEGCGRPEADCSAAPCEDVIADREGC